QDKIVAFIQAGGYGFFDPGRIVGDSLAIKASPPGGSFRSIAVVLSRRSIPAELPGRIDPDFEHFWICSFCLKDVGGHDVSAALANFYTQLAGVLANLMGAYRPVEHREFHAADDAHGVSQHILHLEDIAVLERPDRFA